MSRGVKKLWVGAAVAALTLANINRTGGATGTWSGPTTDNDWNTPGNWVGQTIADGANFTANFTQPDLATGPNLVTMNVTGRVIGNLVFSDANPGTGAAADIWNVQGSSALTLANATQPTITVNALPLGSYAVLNVPVGGTQGFTKAGPGELRLGSLGGAHTITGGFNVNGGTLYYDAGATVPTQAITIRNGATLSVTANIGAPTTGVINVPAANTGNIVTRNGGTTQIHSVGGGAGSTLNVSAATDGAVISAQGNWATSGALGSLNAFGVPGGANEAIRFAANPSGGTAYTQNSLLNTAVALNGIVGLTRTSSSGNIIDIGSLSGNASAVLSGGGSGDPALPTGTGGVATYSIGALNTNTTFAGTIDTQSAIPNTSVQDANNLANRGGLNLTKVGTGTLTLSGTLSYQPVGSTNPSRRGGITTITAGTLKLTGTASLPAGLSEVVVPTVNNAGTQNLGDLLTTVDVRQGATLDVSSVAGYSSSALQQTIGRGTIVGSYSHDEGILAPGDTLSGTSATTVAAAGTLTFQNNLSFPGSGQIKFNVSPSTSSGNDLIQVNGVTSLTGTPTLSIGLLGGIGVGNYAIINSAGGFGGTTPSGWIVDWTGRGTAPALSVVGNQLLLNVNAGNFGSVAWTGAADGTTWDVNGQVNWHNTVTNAADKFFDNDSVTFGDAYGPANTPVINSTITLNSTVSPLNVNFTGNTAPYSITGAGKITGSATLTKTGGAALVLQTANDFTGPANISGGSVDVGTALGALGTGPLTVANATVRLANTSAGSMTNTSLAIPTAATATFHTNGAGSVILPATLTGAGTLAILTDAASKNHDLPTNTSGFTGNVVVGTPGTTNVAIVRTIGTNGSLPNSLVTLNGASSLRDKEGNQVTTLGGLQGEAASTLYGFQGGSGAVQHTWRIGALNTNTTFNGTIVNSSGTLGSTAPNNVHKIGTGTLTLTGTNTYTGRTAVEAGTLSISPADLAGPMPANNYLSDGADVLLFTGATLNLNTNGLTDIIDQLFINGISQPMGVYGALASGAQFETALITGNGLLSVAGFRLPGDFDNNSVVNAADLTVWRTAAAGPNPERNAAGDTDGDGDTDGNDFLIWQRYLGTTNPAVAAQTSVPEPSSAVVAIGAILGLVGAARRRA